MKIISCHVWFNQLFNDVPKPSPSWTADVWVEGLGVIAVNDKGFVSDGMKMVEQEIYVALKKKFGQYISIRENLQITTNGTTAQGQAPSTQTDSRVNYDADGSESAS